jgi:biotin carboxylase
VKRLLVLGAGSAQLGLLGAARRRDLYVVAVDRNPSAPGFQFADRRAIVSVEDEVGIDRLAAAEGVDGIIAPGIDWPVAIAARVAERLGLPHPVSPTTATLAISKLRQRERFAEAGVPQPRNALVRTARDADAVAQRLGFPCVVKPPDRQGQRGLTVVETPGGVGPAVAYALEAARGDVVLVEELVAGPEVSVTGFSVGGHFHALMVADRLVAEPPAFGVAVAHLWPVTSHAREAARVAGAAAEAIGLTDGPTYTQLRLGPDGVRIVEIAARLGGGHDAELCHTVLGVDVNALALAAALGEPIPDADVATRPLVGGGCVRFLVPPPGELRGVGGVAEAEAVDGVQWVRLYHRPGHRYGEFRLGADRAGAVLAVGADADEALTRADEAGSRLRWDTVDSEALV